MHVVSGAGKEGRGVLGNGNFWQNITAGIAAPKFLGHNSQIQGIKKKIKSLKNGRKGKTLKRGQFTVVAASEMVLCHH